jgi:hypothetical protein
MPSKTKMKNAAIAARSAALPSIPKELIDLFVTGPMSGDAVNAASAAFKKALIERAMGAELSHHLGYPPGDAKPEEASNHRNGTSGKTVLTDTGSLRIEVPRDREGSFEPVLIAKHERRFTGFDDKIIAMYARGMTMREVQGFLLESYGVEVSPEFISSVTDAVMAEVGAWQARPLEPMYPVVFFDALRVKIREDAVVWRVNLDARGATIWMRTVSRRVDDAAHLIVAGAIHAGSWLSPDLRALQWRSLRAHAVASTSRRLQSADRDRRGPIRARGAIYAGG